MIALRNTKLLCFMSEVQADQYYWILSESLRDPESKGDEAEWDRHEGNNKGQWMLYISLLSSVSASIWTAYCTIQQEIKFNLSLFAVCFSNTTQMFIYLWHSMSCGVFYRETSVCHVWKHKTYSCFKHANIMFVTSVIISCTFWGWCLIAVLNSRMSQVLVQFGNQYIQLAGCGATQRQQEKTGI